MDFTNTVQHLKFCISLHLARCRAQGTSHFMIYLASWSILSLHTHSDSSIQLGQWLSCKGPISYIFKHIWCNVFTQILDSCYESHIYCHSLKTVPYRTECYKRLPLLKHRMNWIHKHCPGTQPDRSPNYALETRISSKSRDPPADKYSASLTYCIAQNGAGTIHARCRNAFWSVAFEGGRLVHFQDSFFVTATTISPYFMWICQQPFISSRTNDLW